MVLDVTNIDASKCPLCGEENACLNVACGGAENNCWCKNPDIKFPEALTSQVSDALKKKACICEACAKAFKNFEELG